MIKLLRILHFNLIPSYTLLFLSTPHQVSLLHLKHLFVVLLPRDCFPCDFSFSLTLILHQDFILSYGLYNVCSEESLFLVSLLMPLWTAHQERLLPQGKAVLHGHGWLVYSQWLKTTQWAALLHLALLLLGWIQSLSACSRRKGWSPSALRFVCMF